MQVERESGFGHEYSGRRVSNTWVTYLRDWDNLPKGGLIPNETTVTHVTGVKGGLYL